MPVTEKTPHKTQPPTGFAAPTARVLSSETLLDGAKKVLIEHDGELYTLQLTRQGELLLTK